MLTKCPEIEGEGGGWGGEEDDGEEEEVEGKRRDEEDIQDSLVVQEGMTVQFPLV